MMVFEDGEVVRGLSGGCPEADIIERARECLGDGQTRMLHYNRESGLDVLMEQGCGGELEILVEPMTTSTDLSFLMAVGDAIQQGNDGWLATRMPVTNGEEVVRVAHYGDRFWSPGNADAQKCAGLQDRLAVETDAEASAPLSITDDEGAHWLVENFRPLESLFVVGVNAGAKALIHMGMALGWRNTMMRVAREAERPSGLPDQCAFVAGSAEMLAKQIASTPRARVVVMTHSLQDDVACLRALGSVALDYLGAIGSRKRARRLFDESGLRPPQLNAPAGLDLGDETPEAIAVAIMAEIIAKTHGRDGRSLSLTDSGIHA